MKNSKSLDQLIICDNNILFAINNNLLTRLLGNHKIIKNPPYFSTILNATKGKLDNNDFSRLLQNPKIIDYPHLFLLTLEASKGKLSQINILITICNLYASNNIDLLNEVANHSFINTRLIHTTLHTTSIAFNAGYHLITFLGEAIQLIATKTEQAFINSSELDFSKAFFR